MNTVGSWDNINIVKNDEKPNLINTITDEESKIKTFRVKKCIPKKSAKKLWKLLQIIGVVIIIIIFILITIIIVLASNKSKSKGVTSTEYTVATVTEDAIVNISAGVSLVEYTKASKAIENSSAEIVMSDGNRFWTYNPQKDSLKLIWLIKNSAQAFVVDTRKTLYWIENNSWQIFSVNLLTTETDKKESLFFEGSSAKPLKNPSMALDSINNNLYIVDESIQGLVVINVKTKYYALISLELVDARHIVLDAAKGIMFISSKKWIKRADMDGNNLVTIIDDKIIRSFTLDPEGEKIYWIHDSEVIESSDYSGQQKQQILTDLSVIDLIFLDSHLFRLRKSSDIQRKTIWSCKIQNRVCDNHTEHSNTVGTATFMRVTAVHRSKSRQQKPSNRQNCEHISLATPSGQASCVCNMSFHLVSDTKCETITEFVIYTLNGDVRARTFDMSKKIIQEPIWPTPYYSGNLSKKKNIDFDYDFENDDFYFSDDERIYKIKLKEKNPKQEVILTIKSKAFYVANLAYDWLSENMYYLKMSVLTSDVHSLVVFNVKKGAELEKTIAKFLDLSCGLILYPSQNMLFMNTADFDLFILVGYGRHLLDIDDTLSVLPILFKPREEGLTAVDFEEDRLYWISLNGTTLISVNFNGADRRVIYLEEEVLFYIKSISIHRQWVYLSDFEKVWRVDKETGVYDNLVSPLHSDAPRNVDSGAKVISQNQVKENPCRVRNGGCEQFCFYGPKATCDCADEFQVTYEGHCIRDSA